MHLFDRDMLYVTGKGGVGKTTVAAALALAAERAGRRTIVCEVGGQGRIPSLLGAAAGDPGEEQRIGDGLWATTIESWLVLEEWIGRILGSKALTSLLVRSNFFRTFADAAPGGRELGTVVKMWELAQPERWDRHRRTYDLVIVDGPASGHGVGLLRTPGTFADIARVGPIASQSKRVRSWLRDPARTAIVAVALAAELPVSETLDLAGRLDDQLERELDAVVVNGLLPDRFDDGALRAVDAAAPDPHLADALHSAAGRAAEQRAQLGRLREGTGADVRELPFVFADRLRRRDVEALADRLALT